MQKLHTYHLFVIVDVQKLIVGNPPPPWKKPRYIFKTVIFLKLYAIQSNRKDSFNTSVVINIAFLKTCVLNMGVFI